MIRCQVVSDFHSSVSRSFQLRLVASESTVKDALLRVVLVSASLPRNPMNDTRFAYMIFGLLFLLRFVSGHTSRRARGALLPRQGLHFLEGDPGLSWGRSPGKAEAR